MKPVYFPFTYVPKHILDGLYAIFGGIVVYGLPGMGLPGCMQTGIAEGKLGIRTPEGLDETDFASIAADYRSWGDLHRAGRSGQPAPGKAPPSWDDPATSRIKKEIRLKAEGRDPEREGEASSDPLLAATAFLYLAGEYDLQNDEISAGLMSSDREKDKLISDVKGESDGASEETSPRRSRQPDDTGHVMLSERLAAWTYMMQMDHAAPAFFVTSSRAAFEHVLDGVDEAQTVLRAGPLGLTEKESEQMKGWRDGLAEHIARLTAHSGPVSSVALPGPPAGGCCRTKVLLELSIIPGKSPREFFARFTPGVFRSKPEGHLGPRNTVVGLVDATADS